MQPILSRFQVTAVMTSRESKKKKKKKKKNSRKSGGISVYFKEYFSKHISEIETESDYVLWIELSKELFKLDENIILGAVYIPPECSNFF